MPENTTLIIVFQKSNRKSLFVVPLISLDINNAGTKLGLVSEYAQSKLRRSLRILHVSAAVEPPSFEKNNYVHSMNRRLQEKIAKYKTSAKSQGKVSVGNHEAVA